MPFVFLLIRLLLSCRRYRIMVNEGISHPNDHTAPLPRKTEECVSPNNQQRLMQPIPGFAPNDHEQRESER